MPTMGTPFKISIPSSTLSTLQSKLSVCTFPDELESGGWDYGAPLSDIRRLVERWRSPEYDWRAQEAKLNEMMPQYTTDVEVEGYGTMKVHYVHARSERKNAIPLLFVHGWPGSFIEVFKILPALINPPETEQPAFHIVAPSLPGYAFSEGPKKKGFGLRKHAELLNKLMLELGYEEYVTQGGDWGTAITRKIAAYYGPKHCKAWHTNLPLGIEPTLTLLSPSAWPTYLTHLLTPLTPAEQVGTARGQMHQMQGMGYFMQQATQPQTLGYGLADSPVGLLAWIYEKLVKWSDRYAWEDDEVLMWVSIYYFSLAGPAASVRIYYEFAHESGGAFVDAKDPKPTVPHGVSFFPGELFRHPMSWIKNATVNIVYTKEHEQGGHFAAYEKPEELVSDLRMMFGRCGGAYGVVNAASGYDNDMN